MEKTTRGNKPSRGNRRTGAEVHIDEGVLVGQNRQGFGQVGRTSSRHGPEQRKKLEIRNDGDQDASPEHIPQVRQSDVEDPLQRIHTVDGSRLIHIGRDTLYAGHQKKKNKGQLPPQGRDNNRMKGRVGIHNPVHGLVNKAEGSEQKVDQSVVGVKHSSSI